MELALFLKMVFGKNSPKKSTMIVESIVSPTSLIPPGSLRKMVLSSRYAIPMPYITRAILLPTSIVVTKVLGFE